jgi:hypothetical protein
MVEDCEVCMETIGERILSIKQLAMRPIWRAHPATARAVIPSAHLQYKALATSFSVGGFTRYYDTNNTIISLLSTMFSLIRGSSTLRFVPTPVSDGSYHFSSSAIVGVPAAPDFPYQPFAVENVIANFIKIPFYAMNNRVTTAWASPNVLSTMLPTRVIGNAFSGDSECVMGYCASDDFQIGAFSGVPAMVFCHTPPVGAALGPFGRLV